MVQNSAFYPGSFDPLTNGHVDIIQRSLKVFERVTIGLARNVSKTPLFSLEERRSMILSVFGQGSGIDVVIFEGLMVHAAKELGVSVVIRGLRGVADFEYEFQLATMNKMLIPELETMFMMTEKDHCYVSSKLVKEVASLGGSVQEIIPAPVHKALIAKLEGNPFPLPIPTQ